MAEFFTPEMIYVIIPILFLTGAAAGILAGLLGVGGGIVIVPVLYLLAEQLGVSAQSAMHMAVGTSLATIIPTSISSARSHHKKGAIDKEIFKSWSLFIILGAAVGGILSKFFDATIMTRFFGIVALVVSINMLVGKQFIIADKPPKSIPGRTLIGAIIGGFSSLMGIGGGTLSVPLLAMHSTPIHRAVGTSAAFGFLIAVTGTIGFIWSGWSASGRPPMSLGYVNITAVILIIITSTLFAPLGTKLSHWLNAAHLRKAFGVLLIIASMNMLFG